MYERMLHKQEVPHSSNGSGRRSKSSESIGLTAFLFYTFLDN